MLLMALRLVDMKSDVGDPVLKDENNFGGSPPRLYHQYRRCTKSRPVTPRAREGHHVRLRRHPFGGDHAMALIRAPGA
jgi:hypothetical protein